jgi:hypothetical protein
MVPILEEIQVVANAARIELDPMDTLNPNAVIAVLLQGCVTDFEADGCLFPIDEAKHDKTSSDGSNDLVV